MTDLPAEDESVLEPIMTMIETTPILNNQTVKMRLMGKNFYGSPFVYKALCVIFTTRNQARDQTRFSREPAGLDLEPAGLDFEPVGLELEPVGLEFGPKSA